MKTAVFWDVMTHAYYKKRHFAEAYRLHHQGEKNQRAITAFIVPSWLFLYILMMEVIRSSEASDLKVGTRRHIPEDSILPSHRRENLMPYTGVKLLGKIGQCKSPKIAFGLNTDMFNGSE
jgi:hypothetical protein